MNSEEVLSIAKPILFNTDKIRAILDERTMVARLAVHRGKSYPEYHGRDQFYAIVDHLNNDYKNWYAGFYNDYDVFVDSSGKQQIDALYWKAPCKPGDFLYVRETWGCYERNWWEAGYFLYKADYPDGVSTYEFDGHICNLPKWRPSIHMPKEAARIFLRVTDIRVERLQDITSDQIDREGVETEYPFVLNGEERRYAFSQLWTSTLKKSDLAHYGWDANLWVWVIEFERYGQKVGL